MKLHLNTSLRMALLACVCGGFAFTQARAELVSVPGVNDTGDIWLFPVGDTDTTYNITVSDEGKILLLADQNNKQGHQKLSVANGVSVSVQLGEWVGGTTNATYEKHGDGVLTLTGVGRVASQNSTAGTPAHAIVEDGTLEVAYGGTKGFVEESATVKGGATLLLSAEDALGTGQDGNVPTITLTGSSADALATLTVNANNHLVGELNLNGNTLVNGSAYLAGQQASTPEAGKNYGTINVTGENNTISVVLAAKNAMTLNVEDGGKLILANGGKLDNYGTATGHGQFTKIGAGTLTINSGSELSAGASLSIEGGVVEVDADRGLKGNTSVGKGTTLKLLEVDSLGYDNDGKSVSLQGGMVEEVVDGTPTEVLKLATMEVEARQTMKMDINLNGNAEIKSTTGNGTLEGFGGTITATGTNNTISTTLTTRKEHKVVVTDEGDELVITGEIKQSSVTDVSEHRLVKSGEGTLILNGATVATGVALMVNEGTLKAVASDGTTKTYDIHLANNTALQIEHAGVAGDVTAKGSNVIEAVGSGGSAIRSEIVSATKDGTSQNADVTLKGSEDILYVYSDISHTGNLTLQGGTDKYVQVGGDWDGGATTHIHNTGDVTTSGKVIMQGVKTGGSGDLRDITIENGGDINVVSGELVVKDGAIVNNGGTINVQGTAAVGTEGEEGYKAAQTATLKVEAGAEIKSDVSVGALGTLDLSEVHTLNAESLTLESGSTLVLGANQPLTMDGGALTVQSGAIIDLSAWGLSATTFDDETLFTGVDTLTFTDAEGKVLVGEEYGYIQIKFSEDGGLWDYWLYDAGNGNVNAVPEPATATLSLLALAGLAARRRRK